MNNFTPFEKLSKKKQTELNRKRRVTWEGLSPVTRKPKNPKTYDRKKARDWSDDSDYRAFLFEPVEWKLLIYPAHQSFIALLIPALAL